MARTIATGRVLAIAPNYVSSSIDVTGTQLSLVFDAAVVPVNYTVPLVVDSANAAAVYTSGTGTTTLVYNISGGNPSGNPVLNGAVVTVSVPWNTVANSGGIGNIAVSGQSVTNGSTVLVPAGIAGLQLWLPADGTLYQNSNGTTPATANNDPVGYWGDQSTSVLNVTEATNKPTLKTSVLNSKPVIEFDGTNDKLTNVTGLAQGDFTVFIVARLPNGGNDRACLFWGKRATGESRQFHHNSGANMRAFIGYNADRNSTTAWSNNTWQLWSCTGSGVPTSGTATPTIAHRVNGSAAGSGTTSAALKAFTTNALYVGADPDGEFWNGQIAEIIAYNAVLTASQISAVETYLNSKWAVY